MQIAFSQTNADRECDASIGLRALHRCPAGGSAAFLMYYMVGGSWKSRCDCGKCSSSRRGKDWQKHFDEMPMEIVDALGVISSGLSDLLCTSGHVVSDLRHVPELIAHGVHFAY